MEGRMMTRFINNLLKCDDIQKTFTFSYRVSSGMQGKESNSRWTITTVWTYKRIKEFWWIVNLVSHWENYYATYSNNTENKISKMYVENSHQILGIWIWNHLLKMKLLCHHFPVIIIVEIETVNMIGIMISLRKISSMIKSEIGRLHSLWCRNLKLAVQPKVSRAT